MFNVLIINDWHAIAEVFLYASAHSEAFIVYLFFIGANLCTVSILLNCVIAFFVGAFVAKLEAEKVEDAGEVVLVGQKTTVGVDARSTPPLRVLDSSLVAQEDKEMVEFDVYERPTYDKIMRTVAGNDADIRMVEHTKELCDRIGTFEALLPPSTGEIGFLVFSDHFVNQCGTCQFHSMAERFVQVAEIHNIIHRLHSRLLEESEAKQVTETFHHPSQPQVLTIKASLLRQIPPISLQVATIADSTSSKQL